MGLREAAGQAFADADGNLTQDLNKGISSISYNHLNKPTTVSFSNGTQVRYFYSADGTKLRQTVKSLSATTPPVLAIRQRSDYLGLVHYEDPDGDGSAQRVLLFAQHEEGRIRPSGGEILYEYVLTDHLGNTRITFGDADADGQPDILQENHYYPFGLAMTLSGTTAAAPPNDYLYNGKELQDELGLGWLDYGARMYDASIGRWNGVDALAEKYGAWSPYNYVMGNPIKFIDPDGNRADTIIVNTSGREVGQTDSGNDGNISVVSDRTGRQLERGEITTEQAVQSAEFHTTEAVLQEAENVLQRTEENGGDREESSVVEPDGKVHPGKTGPAAANGIARSELPVVTGNNNTSIHSHPINYEVSETGEITSSSALAPGPEDPATFTGYSQNIIVGRLGPTTGTRNLNGTISVAPPSLGAAVYNRNAQLQGQLTRRAIQRILNR